MRSCPHCHKEIQDEAVFCRFCRRDVDPPLWLTSLQKCPFCAEWVERGIDRCPLCGKDLTRATPFSIPAEAVESSDLFSRLRQSAAAPEAEQDEFEPADQESEAPFAAEPQAGSMEAMQGGRSGSWFERMRQPEKPAEDVDEGLGVLQGRRIDLREELDDAPAASDEDETPGASRTRAIQIGSGVLRWVLIAVTAVVLVALAVLAYERITAGGLIFPQASRTQEPTATPPTATTLPATAAPTLGAGTPGVLLPTLPGTAPVECVRWNTITLDMTGQTVCAYGEIKRWFEVSDIPYVAIFSEQPGTFAFIDRQRTFPEFRPGTCITAEGVIESMRATRPFIDVQGNLQECGPDLLEAISSPAP